MKGNVLLEKLRVEREKNSLQRYTFGAQFDFIRIYHRHSKSQASYVDDLIEFKSHILFPTRNTYYESFYHKHFSYYLKNLFVPVKCP